MNIYFKFVIYIVSILISSCADEDPCPRCFEDIVTCKVNGKEWRSNCISNDPLFGCRSITTHYYIYNGNSLNISALNDHNNSGIRIDYSGINGGIAHSHNMIPNIDFGYSNYLLTGNCIRLDSMENNFNNFLILDKIDTFNYIVEGKFGFSSFNLCGDTITITEGYFKTKFLF